MVGHKQLEFLHIRILQNLIIKMAVVVVIILVVVRMVMAGRTNRC